MKKNFLFLLLVFFVAAATFSVAGAVPPKQKIVFQYESSNKSITLKTPEQQEIDNFDYVNYDIDIIFEGIPDSFAVTLVSVKGAKSLDELQPDPSEKDKYTITKLDEEVDSLALVIHYSDKEDTVAIGRKNWRRQSDNGNDITRNDLVEQSARNFFANNTETRKLFALPSDDHYRTNRIYLFFDERGEHIRRMPVNVDADDIFTIFIRVPKGVETKYSVTVTEGEYSPSDLTLRGAEDIRDAVAKAVAKMEISWTYVRYEFGPYTTDYFKFTINFKKDEETQILKPHKIKINKLYHAGFGVSFLKTELENPSFDTAPLTDTTNTIIALDEGKRSIITVNVIWYWRIFHWDFWKGSALTEGRDILKELPWYDRIYPTFGVSLDGKFRENFFYGFVYEFARGANITYGWHYGKVRRLADEGFKIGEDVFTGSKEDVKTTNKWETKPFVGLNVDTRIFSAILGLGK